MDIYFLPPLPRPPQAGPAGFVPPDGQQASHGRQTASRIVPWGKAIIPPPGGSGKGGGREPLPSAAYVPYSRFLRSPPPTGPGPALSAPRQTKSPRHAEDRIPGTGGVVSFYALERDTEARSFSQPRAERSAGYRTRSGQRGVWESPRIRQSAPARGGWGARHLGKCAPSHANAAPRCRVNSGAAMSLDVNCGARSGIYTPSRLPTLYIR